MTKEFIPYEQALALKELGFNESCFGYYVTVEVPNPFLVTTKISDTQGGYFTFAPTYSQAFRWFREKYQLYSWVKIEYEYGGITPTYCITGKRQDDIPGGPFKTCEEAELACLEKLIEIVKNEKQ